METSSLQIGTYQVVEEAKVLEPIGSARLSTCTAVSVTVIDGDNAVLPQQRG